MGQARAPLVWRFGLRAESNGLSGWHLNVGNLLAFPSIHDKPIVAQNCGSYMSLPVFTCRYLSLPVLTCLYMSLRVLTCLCLSVPLFMCLYLAACAYLSLPVTCVYLSLPVFSSLCLSLPVFT